MSFVIVYCYNNGDWIARERNDEKDLRELFKEDYKEYIDLAEENGYEEDEVLEDAKKVYETMDGLSLEDLCTLMCKLGDVLVHTYDRYGVRVIARGSVIAG